VIVLDTNILARFLLNDDPEQFQRARDLIDGPQRFTAPVTVILELVWVLRVNGCDKTDIVKGLRLLLGLPNFTVKDPEILLRALGWVEQGMDFGDALHLAMSARDQEMVTFDRSIRRHSEMHLIRLRNGPHSGPYVAPPTRHFSQGCPRVGSVAKNVAWMEPGGKKRS